MKSFKVAQNHLIIDQDTINICKRENGIQQYYNGAAYTPRFNYGLLLISKPDLEDKTLELLASLCDLWISFNPVFSAFVTIGKDALRGVPEGRNVLLR